MFLAATSTIWGVRRDMCTAGRARDSLWAPLPRTAAPFTRSGSATELPPVARPPSSRPCASRSSSGRQRPRRRACSATDAQRPPRRPRRSQPGCSTPQRRAMGGPEQEGARYVLRPLGGRARGRGSPRPPQRWPVAPGRHRHRMLYVIATLAQHTRPRHYFDTTSTWVRR